MVHLDLGNLVVHLRADTSQYDRALKQAIVRMKALSTKLIAIGRRMMFAVSLPLTIIGTLSTIAFGKFDDAMTKSLAIMGDVSEKMRKEMTQLARTMSLEATTSATDLAKAYFFLASAGFSAEQSMASLGAVNMFAIAGNFDMAIATDLATDAQSALGLTVDDVQKNLKNMIRVTDALVGANSLANATTLQFSEALVRSGPAMKAYGIELEEGMAVLAAFADQGKKGAVGGELFARMLRLMIKGAINNRAAWRRFGLTIVDTNDRMRPLADIIRDITQAIDHMGVTEKGRALEALGFTARTQKAILPLLALGNAVENYHIQMLKMGGVTKEVAEKNMKSFAAQMKILWNNIVNVGIEIGSILAPHLLKLNKIIIRGTNAFMALSDTTKLWIVGIAGIAIAIGPVLILAGLLINSIIAIGTAIAALFTPIGAVIALLVALAVAVASPSIGKFLFENFKFIQKAVTNLVIDLQVQWAILKDAFRSLAEDMKSVWIKAVNLIKMSVATLMEAFGALPGNKSFKVLGKALRQSIKNPIDESIASIKMLEAEITLLERTRSATMADIDREFAERVAKRAAKTAEALAKMKAKLSGLFGKSGGDKGGLGLFDAEAFNMRVQEWIDDASNISENVADAFVSGLDRLSDGISDLLFKGEADFKRILGSIAEDITRQLIRLQIASVVGAPVFGIGAGIAHGGGMVGNIPNSRSVPAGLFAGAPRFHNGLASDEFAMIAQRGEVILSKENVAELKEGSGRGGGRTVINNFNMSAIDGRSMAQLFKKHRRQIVSATRASDRENNPIRRNR